jgi:hypothetical protein
MFGAWEAPDIASFWFALGAFVLSVIALGFTYAAHRREVWRERERPRPPVTARFDKWLSEPLVALFTLENHGAVVVDRAVVRVVTGDANLVGFAENESSHPRLREYDFGRLSPGEPVSAEFVTLEKAAHDSRSEAFVIAFERDKDKWSEQYRVDLPPRSPKYGKNDGPADRSVRAVASCWSGVARLSGDSFDVAAEPELVGLPRRDAGVARGR